MNAIALLKEYQPQLRYDGFLRQAGHFHLNKLLLLFPRLQDGHHVLAPLRSQFSGRSRSLHSDRPQLLYWRPSTQVSSLAHLALSAHLLSPLHAPFSSPQRKLVHPAQLLLLPEDLPHFDS